MNFLPVLAFDRDLIGIVIAVIWVLGIVVRVIKGSKENVEPPARRDRPEQLRTEIEEFLDEIAGNSQRKPNRQVPEQKPPERTRPPVKTQTNKKQTPKQKQTAKSTLKPTVKPTVASKPVKLAEQHLQTSNLGGELRSHLATYMQTDRVGQEVQRDMQNRIAAEVEADLGRPTATQAPPVQTPVHPLVKMLRDPQGARTAIAIQEILQRPRSLR